MNLLVYSRIPRRATRILTEPAGAPTTLCDCCSTTSYLPGQKETICLILDLALFRSTAVSSQIEPFPSRFTMSYPVTSIVFPRGLRPVPESYLPPPRHQALSLMVAMVMNLHPPRSQAAGLF